MVRLSISLLGGLQVTLDGLPIADFGYDKVWALMVYLVVEAHQPHRRATLAALFWADSSEERARGNLRQALTTLRHLLQERQAPVPFLLTTRQTIQFNRNSSYRLDVTEFLSLSQPLSGQSETASELTDKDVAQLEQAIALYPGDFLVAVKSFDSEAFEEWMVLTRDRLQGLAVNICTCLTRYYRAQQNWQLMQRYAQRLLQIEPWNEFAHQSLMQGFTYAGQRGAAMQQYKQCAQLLAQQLQTEPDRITTELYHRIRNGAFTLKGKISSVEASPATASTEAIAPLSPALGREGSNLPLTLLAPTQSQAQPQSGLGTIVKIASNSPIVGFREGEPTTSPAIEPFNPLPDFDWNAIVKTASNQPVFDTQLHQLRNLPEENGLELETQNSPLPQDIDLPSDQQNRRRLLEKVDLFWIKGVLENALHRAGYINLRLEARSDKVAYPWKSLMPSADRAQRVLPAETRIIDLSDQLNHSLLILGLPGSGKTTLLLDLARSLLTRASQDPHQPMPVVFNLSSWSDHAGSLATWLIHELQFRYQVPQPLAQCWIQSAQILPLLDGLDEVAVHQREACVTAINQFRSTHWLTNLVVCSRTDEYDALRQALKLNGAIFVQPLTLAQIDQCLAQVGDGLLGLRSLLQQDTALQELANTPLMVNIIALVYQDKSLDALALQAFPQNWQNHLFAIYIQQMLVHRGADPRYADQQVIRWLAWLAHTLMQRDQTLFLIEQLQPDDLNSDGQRRGLMIIETATVALLMGLAGGGGVGLHQGFAAGWSDGLLSWLNSGLLGMMRGLGVGLLVGLLLSFLLSLLRIGLDELVNQRTAQTLNINALNINTQQKSKLWRSVGHAMRLGVTAGISQGLSIGLFLGVRFGLGAVLVVSLCMGLAAWRFLKPDRIVLLEVWQWSWLRSRFGLILGVTLGSGLGLMYGISYGATYGWVMGVGIWLMVAVSGGFTSHEIATKIAPNQGIWYSLVSAWRMSLAIGIPFGLANGIGYSLMLGWPGGIGKGIGSAIESGTASWLICGGLTGIQHLAIRAFLAGNGAMPWNYAAFLDYATERTFLRKVGGNYMFVHRLLLEYFATLHPQIVNPNNLQKEK
ncbi:MAG: NACHT domain-containing protein [Oculatellaceae cyanobacterium Prado106]|jgi:DNA-binding SARP family transcriptional activator/DNA polymerase III delta prime subunit|nr:NACHT domain-containing protein [Oculatellaceae cyanobacterium Prado106]